MRILLLIIVFLTLGIRSIAQDTVNVYLRDTLIYKVALKGDTAFWYDAKTMDLESIIYDKDNSTPDRWVFESWDVVNGVKESMFRYELKKGLKADGFCHGIKADGNRCTRSVKAGIFYCWQHD
jgi:hypothetical protein